MSGPLTAMSLSEWVEWLDRYKFDHPNNLAEAVRLYEDTLRSGEVILKVNRASSTRVLKTLLRMLRGLLSVAYKWDPESEDALFIPELRGDLAAAGVALDDDTLRKWVEEAALVD